MGPADDALSEGDDHRSHRHFVLGCRQRSFLESHLHVVEMERMPRIDQRQVEERPFQALLRSRKGYLRSADTSLKRQQSPFAGASGLCGVIVAVETGPIPASPQ